MKKILVFAFVAALILGLAFRLKEGIVVSGKVIDAEGTPIAGASVILKGSSRGTISDTLGNFIITVPGKGAILLISALAQLPVEVVVSGPTLTAVLQPGYSAPGEAVVPSTTNKKFMHTAQPSRGAQDYNLNAGAELGFTEGEYKPWPEDQGYNREGYDNIVENRFLKVTDNPLSTFSIDVDAASYSNIRRMLKGEQLPPAGAVRIEEMINYFNYDYPQPAGSTPFSINTEIAVCPWNAQHRLLSIGLQGKTYNTEKLPPSNLTFLIDVSGSMEDENKLPLVKSSLKLLAEQLRSQDKVSIVVYAGNAGLVLKPTAGNQKAAILQAINNLEAGGSTAGGEGIRLAYAAARKNYFEDGNNRVILCTDGDFNVGISSDDELERMIEKERESGIYLTVLGFGMGNYQDAKMQKLADKGNGNHAYIDHLNEARKVLVNEFGGTLFTIAKDVKLQIEFNPGKVQGYRLVGYENRVLAKEDFNNDKKDAGELGSGHTVTALYELIPTGVKAAVLDSVDELRYQKPVKYQAAAAFNGELLNIKLRYKKPRGSASLLLQHPVDDSPKALVEASQNLRFAACVAQFGMLLRNSANKGSSNYEGLLTVATSTLSNDKGGYRKEFLELVKIAQRLSKDIALKD